MTSKALAPEKLVRVFPRHLFLDLDEETPGITREEVLQPEFWADAADQLRFGDIVTAASKTFSVTVRIGLPYQDGGLEVSPFSAQNEAAAHSLRLLASLVEAFR